MSVAINEEGIMIDGVQRVAFPSVPTNLSEVGFSKSNDIFVKPSRGALFSKTSSISIRVPAGFAVKVGNVVVSREADLVLSLATDLDTGVKVAGTDYYVYALSTGGFKISANNSYPAGHDATDSRKVGGFHYGIIPETFSARNNITAADASAIAGINAYSFWDLKFRPKCSPEGMANILGRWYDIYLLNSNHVLNGTSKAGAIIAAGATTYNRAIPKVPLAFGGNGTTDYGTLTYYEACEIAKAHQKELIDYAEFPAIAYGVKEASSADTLDDGTIKHLDDYASKWGIVQASGVQWIWGKNLANYPTDTTFAWKTDKTEGRGSIYSTENSPTAVLLGGNRDYGVNSGSRCSGWNNYAWVSSWNIGCRFACDHLELV